MRPFALLKRHKHMPHIARDAVKNNDGSVLIEFAILAVPFFAIIGAILETAFLLLASQVLDAAVDTASRKIRTGQAQTANYDMASFRSAVCDDLYGLFDCTQLRIFVSPVTSFSAATLGNSVVDMSDGSWDDAEAYNDGSGSSIILAQVYYKWPTFLKIMTFDMATLPDNTHLIGAARLFENEPFG